MAQAAVAAEMVLVAQVGAIPAVEVVVTAGLVMAVVVEEVEATWAVVVVATAEGLMGAGEV